MARVRDRVAHRVAAVEPPPSDQRRAGPAGGFCLNLFLVPRDFFSGPTQIELFSHQNFVRVHDLIYRVSLLL